jgi:uncharacterized protein (DUF427 family)
MKAMWLGQLIAGSDRTIELDGYHYFPPESVRKEFLRSAPKTEADHRCPHSVQFFNLSDGTHSSERAAWAYEAPRASYAHVAHWIGFWKRRRTAALTNRAEEERSGFGIGVEVTATLLSQVGPLPFHLSPFFSWIADARNALSAPRRGLNRLRFAIVRSGTFAWIMARRRRGSHPPTRVAASPTHSPPPPVGSQTRRVGAYRRYRIVSCAGP